MLEETKKLLKAMEKDEPWLDFADDLENFLNFDNNIQKKVIQEIYEIPPGLNLKNYFCCILRNNIIEGKYLKKIAKLKIVNFQEIFDDCCEKIFANHDSEEMKLDLERLHSFVKLQKINIQTFEQILDELKIGGYKFTPEHKRTIQKIKKKGEKK